MAKILLGNKTEDLKDGDPIIHACQKLGVPFSCKDGMCGSCFVNILEGEDNLADLNDKEKNFGISSKKQRLCCQAKIISGDVTLESKY